MTSFQDNASRLVQKDLIFASEKSLFLIVFGSTSILTNQKRAGQVAQMPYLPYLPRPFKVLYSSSVAWPFRQLRSSQVLFKPDISDTQYLLYPILMISDISDISDV